jgi:electron transfer flavoprotein beta subunit
VIGACLKWVDRRPEPNAVIAGTDTPDERFAGVSVADQAALEWALRCRDATGGDVVAITVGPPAAESVLRDALAAGATHAIRIDLPFGAPSTIVASALAAQLHGARSIWCGDYSFDRGTGSVPAFLAGELGIAQALGLVGIDLTHVASAGTIGAVRRLDGGRREVLSVDRRAVLSVEGSTALLRRASLRNMLASRPVDVVSSAASATTTDEAITGSRPYRPRPRVFAPPAGATALDRIKELTSAGATVTHGETVVLEPAAAADRILSTLHEWGYL